MVPGSGEFEEIPEDDQYLPPVPPDDRLWRHPSELAKLAPSCSLDPALVRNRWLLSHPSRASASTAGLVGALLATGVVLLGTHFASILTSNGAAAPVTLSSLATPAATSAVSSPAIAPLALSASLAASAGSVGAAVVSIEVTRGARTVPVVGLVVNSVGTIVTASTPLTGATAILVHLPGGELVPALAVSADRDSGLAVLHVNAAETLAVASFSSTPEPAGGLALAVTAPGASHYSLGIIRSVDLEPRLGGKALIDADRADLPAAATPPGSPVLGADGGIVGLVIGHDRAGAIIVPSWLAAPVERQLAMAGRVDPAWIGVDGTNEANGGGIVVASTSGPAMKAGLDRGDVITALDGRPVASMVEFCGRIYAGRPGEVVTLSVQRGAATMRLNVALSSTST